MNRALRSVKNRIIPFGKKPRTILFGLLRGLKYGIDMKTQLQTLVGLDEVELVPYFRKFTKGAQTIFDVGANEGRYTLFFLGKTKAPKVFAFEPISEIADILMENLRLNPEINLDRLVLSEKFIGSKSDGAHCSLDSFVPEVRTPCVIKMDIEGGELDALQSAKKLLALPDVRLIIEVHSSELRKACTTLLQEMGYTVTNVPRALIRVVVPKQRIADNGWIVATR